mgnify:CR=1 FL=1
MLNLVFFSIYNICVGAIPILKVRLLNGVYTGGYAHFYIHRLYAESMKGGMLMKS